MASGRVQTFQKGFAHLLNSPRPSGPYPTASGRLHVKLNPVKPGDRIPYWNILPGDLVRVVQGHESIRGKDGTVKGVDRANNVVFLEEETFKRRVYPRVAHHEQVVDPSQPQFTLAPIPIHYCNLRLVKEEVVGDSLTTRIATRLKRGPVTRHRNGQLIWRRFGLFDGKWEEIPTQVEDKEAPVLGPIQEDVPDNTPTSVANAITFFPMLPKSASFLLSSRRRLVPGFPPELGLPGIEFGNKHGTFARKQKRRRREEELQMTRDEVKHGRSKTRARRDSATSSKSETESALDDVD